MLKKVILPLAVVGAAVFLVVVMTANRPAPEKRAPEERAMLVNVEPVQAQSLRFEISSQGTVRPRTETALVSELAGKIVSVAPEFVAGGFFRRGDVLIEIDPSDYETAVKQAQATLAGREAQLAQEAARGEQALKDWDKLGRRGEGPSALVLRKPQLAEAEAAVEAARADLMRARRNLERSKIRAPYDGMVREKLVGIGQYVSPGTRLGAAFAIDRAEVRLPLPERELAYVELPWIATAGGPRPAAVLRATVAGKDVLRRVEIVRTEGVLDEATRVVYAVAEIVDPYGVLGNTNADILPIGTFVDASIEGVQANDVVALPRYSLRSDGTVLVAGDNDELEIRNVEVVRSEQDLVYVAKGLVGGDRVITSSVQVPIPGAKLTIAGPSSDSVPETDAAVAGGDEEAAPSVDPPAQDAANLSAQAGG